MNKSYHFTYYIKHHDVYIVHIYEILFSKSRKVFYKPYRKCFGHKETWGHRGLEDTLNI